MRRNSKKGEQQLNHSTTAENFTAELLLVEPRSAPPLGVGCGARMRRPSPWALGLGSMLSGSAIGGGDDLPFAVGSDELRGPTGASPHGQTIFSMISRLD